MKKNRIIFALLLVTIGVIFFSVECQSPKKQNGSENLETPHYLNHADSARYVGINACKTCHYEIYTSFIETGMGQSFDIASKKKSAALFGPSNVIYDSYSDFYYHPYFSGDTMKILEFRINGKDTVYKRTETVNYIIGSGQHTNSHMMIRDGFVTQMPMTFYTQKKQWDLPPGFENGYNSRFSRKIGLECMSCHNSYPDFVLGSENKFNAIPHGIGCERCHGPGSIHVDLKTKNQIVDTAKNIDYSIVNPAKLAPNLQFDICQRCHLQGNTILKDNYSFYDFKPGKKLSDFMTVFLPKFSHADDEFIMASHADRLKQSQCFIQSQKYVDSSSLKPYKNTMTCVTCHNPHKSVKFQKDEFFNAKCNSCHAEKQVATCSETKSKIDLQKNNCVSCHMPNSGSIDIPHVTVHDHYIRKPKPATELKKAKEFLGLIAINELNPNHKTKAQAYINQYEKFDKVAYYLDSAEVYTNILRKQSLTLFLDVIVHLNFLKGNYSQIIADVEKIGQVKLINDILVHPSYNNKDAWLCYRIGEAYQTQMEYTKAMVYYAQANKLAPYYPDFLNKYAGACLNNNQLPQAQSLYIKLTQNFPEFAPGFSNLGFIYLTQNDKVNAHKYITKALQLDPDYELALMNKVSLLLYENNIKEAQKILKKIIKRNPKQEKAKELLLQLH